MKNQGYTYKIQCEKNQNETMSRVRTSYMLLLIKKLTEKYTVKT